MKTSMESSAVEGFESGDAILLFQSMPVGLGLDACSTGI
jgi:hypothetical protein